MPRATVRAAIVDYLQGAGVTSLGTVTGYPHKITPEGDFFTGLAPGVADGAIIFVHLHTQNERRIALGGPTSGVKMRQYGVALISLFRSTEPDAATVGAANDAFLDSLTAAIEANRTAGDPAAIFQWGEADTLGGLDITVQSEMPRTLRLGVAEVFNVVEVSAIEMLQT